MTIWCNQPLPTPALELLREGLGRHRLTPLLGEADVAFGQPDPDELMRLRRLRWVHLTSAGYTAYDREDFRAHLGRTGAVLTNSSDVYDEPCALHVLAMMTALARQLPAALDAQRGAREWPQEALRARSSLLSGETALLLGFGAIARRLVELLAPLNMRLIGVRRRVAGDEPIRVVAEAEVEEYLAQADHVVNILPANPGTKNFLDARRLGAVKPGAILYNIGRGATLDQDALIAALRAGRLAAAYLDVTDPEPLPPGHPLWDAPNCHITPHTAGGHADEMERLVRHFLGNLGRFSGGESLINRVM